jgi:AraC-like DNA-binding protein
MPRPHAHGDVELNLVTAGGFTYFMGARRHRVRKGRLHVFWAGAPHQIIACAPGTRQVWLTVPLSSLLRFGLPDTFVRRLLEGALLTEAASDPEDPARFARWARELGAASADPVRPGAATASQAGPGSPALRRAVELEVEARLLRFAAALPAVPPVPTASPIRRGRPGHPAVFERLAAALHDRYLEDAPLADLTGSAGLGADYAAQIFRRACGLTPLEYRNRLRVAHAQRLLVIDDRAVAEIALEAGFGSVNRFYVAFRRVTGMTPLAFRRSLP